MSICDSPTTSPLITNTASMKKFLSRYVVLESFASIIAIAKTYSLYAILTKNAVYIEPDRNIPQDAMMVMNIAAGISAISCERMPATSAVIPMANPSPNCLSAANTAPL